MAEVDNYLENRSNGYKYSNLLIFKPLIINSKIVRSQQLNGKRVEKSGSTFLNLVLCGNISNNVIYIF